MNMGREDDCWDTPGWRSHYGFLRSYFVRLVSEDAN